MEELGYIVVGLVLLLLVFVANLIRVVVRHRRVVREAHRARASSMLQGAGRYLEDTAEQEPDIAAPPAAGPAVSVPRPDFTLPEVRRVQDRPLTPVPPLSTFESDFGLAPLEPTQLSVAEPITTPLVPSDDVVGGAEEVLPGEASVASWGAEEGHPEVHEVLQEAQETPLEAEAAYEAPGPERPSLAPSLPVPALERPEPEPEPPLPAPDPEPSIPETYSLVAPVELHFSGTPGRVGVKAGTPLQVEFLRIANLLLDDLAASRRR